MKDESQGLSPKVPIQAVVTLIVGVLAYFGVDLSVELSAALAVVLGFAAGYLAPPAPTKPAARRRRVKHPAGQSIVEVLLIVFLVLVVLVVLFRLL